MTGNIQKIVCGFTQSNRVHLLIEITGDENYIFNNIKPGDKIKLNHGNRKI